MWAVDLPLGVVYAIVFILSHIILNVFLDFVLSNIACILYYRQVKAGKPIVVRSVGLSDQNSYVLGRPISITNVSILLPKLACISLLAAVPWGISYGNVQTLSSKQSCLGAYEFDPSEEGYQETVEAQLVRYWEISRSCRELVEEKIVYYQTVFNLSADRDNDSHIRRVDERSFRCLSPRFVSEQDAKIVARVTGCSETTHTDCLFKSSLVTEIPASLFFNNHSLVEIENARFFLSQQSAESLKPYWETENNVSIDCMFTRFTASNRSEALKGGCLSIERNGTHTTLEQWNVRRLNVSGNMSLEREFPGPVFEGDYSIATIIVAVNLIDFLHEKTWVDLSSSVVAEGMVYKRKRTDFREVQRVDIRVIIPTESYSIMAFIILTILTINMWVSVALLKDKRPRFNKINGLSSILREELEPTGCSMLRGKTWMFAGKLKNSTEA